MIFGSITLGIILFAPNPIILDNGRRDEILGVADPLVTYAGDRHQTAGVQRGNGHFPGSREGLLTRLGIGLYIPFSRNVFAAVVANSHATVHTHQTRALGNSRLSPQGSGDIWHWAN